MNQCQRLRRIIIVNIYLQFASNRSIRLKPGFGLVLFLIAAVFLTTASVVCAQTATFKTLHTFGTIYDSAYPKGKLALGLDGSYYGVSEQGGANNDGTVYKLSVTGEFTILHSFGVDDASPNSLILGRDGNFYGTCSQRYIISGISAGVVFRISPLGDYTILHSFSTGGNTAGNSDGYGPRGAMIQAADGNFYGTTAGGGFAGGGGTIYRMSPDGILTILHSFNSAESQSSTNVGGAYPNAALIQAGDGNLYGYTSAGGPGGAGVFFRMTLDGSVTVICDLDFPLSLILGADGNFYGTEEGDSYGVNGLIFKLTPTGVLTTLHAFSLGKPDSLVQTRDGNFYGTITRASGTGDVDGSIFETDGAAFFEMTPDGSVTLLYQFDNSDGQQFYLAGYSDLALTLAGDGNFYVSSYTGGASGLGTVFKITPDGIPTSLHSFSGANADGIIPSQELVQGPEGNIYGVTANGGSSDDGVLFSLTPGGSLTVRHNFTLKNARNGIQQGIPSSLILGGDGNIYGTTLGDNQTTQDANNYGTIFKMIPGGEFTTLYDFSQAGSTRQDPRSLIQCNDGNFYGLDDDKSSTGGTELFKLTPAGTLTAVYNFAHNNVNRVTQARDGNFYGTAVNFDGSDNGAVFKVTPTGTLTTLHLFTGTGSDGAGPAAGLVQGSDGNFYGTTTKGGTNQDGTVFRITPAGVLNTLHSFTGIDGQYPTADLVQGSDGNFYGTTFAGGINSSGSIFQVTPAGVLTTLYSFSASVDFTNGDGMNPTAGLLQGNDGNFYGTASQGGALGNGTAFVLSFGPAITSAVNAAGTLGQPFSYRITANDSPTGYDASGLPAGLNIDQATGIISGTPAQLGSFSVNLSATNAHGTSTATLALTITSVDTLPSAMLTATTSSVTVGNGAKGQFTMNLSTPSSGDTVVNYAIKGTGTNGVDYVLLKGTTKFKAGKTSKPIKIIPLGDLGGAAKKTVKLTVEPGSGYSIGSNSTAKMKIFSSVP